jgi:hypothetical protein
MCPTGWSVTMHDYGGFLAANPLNRYAVGSRDAALQDKAVDGRLSTWHRVLLSVAEFSRE